MTATLENLAAKRPGQSDFSSRHEFKRRALFLIDAPPLPQNRSFLPKSARFCNAAAINEAEKTRTSQGGSYAEITFPMLNLH